ncbi:MAG: hypothetical protein QM817_26450 [Archangium sp.]
MRSARSSGSFASCTTILLPGTSALGFANHCSSVFSFHTRFEARNASE